MGDKNVPISVSDAVLGTKLEVPTIDGKVEFVHQTKYSISAQGLKLNQILKTGTYHIYGSITGEVTKRRMTATKVGQYLAFDIEWFMSNDPPVWSNMYFRSTADVKII